MQPLKAEYPAELLAARRAAFMAQIDKYNVVETEEASVDEPIVKLLDVLKPAMGEYPPELMSARRAAFIAQIKQHNDVEDTEELASEEQVLHALEGLKPIAEEYPAELFAARRAAFMAQIEQYNGAVVEQDLPSENGTIYRLLERLQTLELNYPSKLWIARRSAFIAQIREGRTSILDALRLAVQSLFNAKSQPSRAPTRRSLRTSLVVAGFALATFLGALLYGNRVQVTEMLNPPQGEVAHLPAATSTAETAEVSCKPGYVPPLCLVQEAEQSQEALTFPGNGTARPAVAKDTIPGYGRIHKAAYANDGLYGPGASWVSNSAFSWIKIDLGKMTTINTITFGRDRLGRFNDGDPGQFVIAVAADDDIYADGNSNNDFAEYTQVYDSEEVGFDGIISGPETIKANFKPVMARFVKITFENPGTAVDEIEAFMIQPPGFVNNPTQRPRESQPRETFTPVPTNTLIPSRTPTALPTFTALPTSTHTPRPTSTATPLPTSTPTDVPTNTPLPTDTPVPPTSTLQPTSTPQPPTSTPAPTNTPEPVDTPIPILTEATTDSEP